MNRMVTAALLVGIVIGGAVGAFVMGLALSCEEEDWEEEDWEDDYE